MHDRVALSLHGKGAQTNYNPGHYPEASAQPLDLEGKTRAELQRALGVRPMDKSSRSVHSPAPASPQAPAARAWQSWVATMLDDFALQMPMFRTHVC